MSSNLELLLRFRNESMIQEEQKNNNNMPTTREEHVKYTRSEWNSGEYFPRIINILKENNIKSMIDIGSNVGEVVNVMIENIPSLNDIYIFEPHVDNMSFLKENIKNNSSGKNITYYPFGVYYGERTSKMYQDPNHRNVGGFQVEHARKEIEKIREHQLVDNLGLERFEPIEHIIELRTLEELSIPNVDFIKIDVEMSEYNIIENSNFIKSSKFMDIEFHFCTDVFGYVKNNIPTHEIIHHGDGHVFLKIK